MIKLSQLSLGIELGSTRIKGILIDRNGNVITEGQYSWENKLEKGIWTYNLDDVWEGIQIVYSQIKENFFDEHRIKLTTIGSIGFSAMMHGYMPFDETGELLVPFRTWRNSITAQAQEELTELFGFNIPQRWSIAHLYQAMIDGEKHLSQLDYFTTLSGYVHWKLTGEKVLGINDASGMFPIDQQTKTYDLDMIEKFNTSLNNHGLKHRIDELLPKPLLAGDVAGYLTNEGALLLDPSGDLKPGIPFAPPEGDAGTGMIATNSIKARTGNVSAGTSVFAMFVLEKPLENVYPEIDIVATPLGDTVAMVHVNNCTSEINAWVNIFSELTQLLDVEVTESDLFELLFKEALKSDEGLDGILTYGYHSGENITGFKEGRPLVVRKPNIKFTLANFMRALIDSAFATLSIGMQILNEESIQIDSIVGHGGIFKTEGVAQRIVANALKSKVVLMDTASEGGAWGMALLAQYVLRSDEFDLETYLDQIIFGDTKKLEYTPDKDEILQFENFVKRYQKGLRIEEAAVENLC